MLFLLFLPPSLFSHDKGLEGCFIILRYLCRSSISGEIVVVGGNVDPDGNVDFPFDIIDGTSAAAVVVAMKEWYDDAGRLRSSSSHLFTN